MTIGQKLRAARDRAGLTQESAAEALGVSRQTLSSWENDRSYPDIAATITLSGLYGLTLDDLIAFDLEVQEIQEVIDRTREEVSDKIDWTKAWSKKYPVLAQYQSQVDAAPYAAELERLLEELKRTCGYNELDAFLVLKDILAQVWKARKRV